MGLEKCPNEGLDGIWCWSPSTVKGVSHSHFANPPACFQLPITTTYPSSLKMPWPYPTLEHFIIELSSQPYQILISHVGCAQSVTSFFNPSLYASCQLFTKWTLLILWGLRQLCKITSQYNTIIDKPILWSYGILSTCIDELSINAESLVHIDNEFSWGWLLVCLTEWP